MVEHRPTDTAQKVVVVSGGSRGLGLAIVQHLLAKGVRVATFSRTRTRPLDELVSSFVGSLESADTAALLRLTISRAEFAYLVFPDSPFSAPPYAQAPDLVWMRHATTSGTGLNRLLARAGGASLGFRSWSCSALPEKQGVNRVWGGCKVRFARGGDTEQTLQLFASIIERQGRFKILSYANAF